MKKAVLKKLAGLVLLLTFITAPIFGSFATPAQAADFDYNIERTYTAQPGQSTIHITEKRTVYNNSLLFYYPVTSKETFLIQSFKEDSGEDELNTKENSIVVTNGYGTPLTYTTTKEDDSIEVVVNYHSALHPGNSITFQLEYDTTELLEQVGQVTNIYIPGLDESYEAIKTDVDSGTSSELTYETTLEVSKSLGTPTFTLPEATNVTETPEQTIYEFSTESILGTTVWHQIGTEQTYYFKITQPVTKVDSTTPEQFSFLSKSQYTILLPRDYSETNQKVFYTDISPSPDQVYLDDDGNVLATFYIDATTESEITIEGYITVSLPEDANSQQPTANIDEIDTEAMSKYLAPAEFWETEHPDIQAKAAEMAEGKTSIIDILRADYEFIVDSIDYDNFKYGERNTRKGALATLHGDSSVCMEYSDLLISLARAQGIPARAAYGYGYDPKFAPEEQEEHQWTQAWVPEYGWLTIDPTWGETGREFIGRDLDHALWYVASTHPNNPNPLEVFAAVSNFEIEDSVIETIAVKEIPQDIELKTVNELVEETGGEPSSADEIMRIIQTTIIGRVLVIILPICGTVLIAFFVISLLIKIVSKISKRKRSEKEAGSKETRQNPKAPDTTLPPSGNAPSGPAPTSTTPPDTTPSST